MVQVPYQALAGAATAIGQVLCKQGVIGYLGIDFVTFFDKAVGAQRLWAVDLNLRLTSTACSFALFNFLMGGEVRTTRTCASARLVPPCAAPHAGADVPVPPPLVQLDADTGMYVVDTSARPSSSVSEAGSVASRRCVASRGSCGRARYAVGMLCFSCHVTAVLLCMPYSTASSFMHQSGVLLGDRPRSTASRGVADAGSDSVMSSARSFRRPTAAASHGNTLPRGFVYRSYVAHDYVFHPNLSSLQYASFFNLCRLQGISFDLHERVGTAFVLVDSLAGGACPMDWPPPPHPMMHSADSVIACLRLRACVLKRGGGRHLGHAQRREGPGGRV